MSERHFLDTNVFVYSFDRRERTKMRKARALIANALATRSGVISTQILQEFVHVATRKFSVPMTVAECGQYVDRVLAPLCEIFPSLSLYKEALGVMEETGFTFYDALVIAGAASAGCTTLYTEDLQDGRSVRGVLIRNPFK